MNHKFQNHVRRIEDKNWYWISRSILKHYGHILGPGGLAVYNVLASYANSKSQTCYPTQKKIAERIGLRRETVNRKIKFLRENRLIRVKRMKGRCLYFLLKPDVILNHTSCDRRITRYVTQNHTNNNKYIELINKNNRGGCLNNFKALRQLLKRYDKKG